MEKDTLLQVMLDPDMTARLDVVAAKLQTTKAALTREALAALLARLEDMPSPFVHTGKGDTCR